MYKEGYGGREENDARAQSAERRNGNEHTCLLGFPLPFCWTSTWLSVDVTGCSAAMTSVEMLLVGRQITWLLGQAGLATLLSSVDFP